MKVSGNQPPVVQDLKTGKAQEKEVTGRSTGSAESAEQNTSVKTSSFATDKIKNRIAMEPEVRTDRVAELKAKIQNGEYKIDAQHLAGKMLKDSLLEDLS